MGNGPSKNEAPSVAAPTDLPPHWMKPTATTPCKSAAAPAATTAATALVAPAACTAFAALASGVNGVEAKHSSATSVGPFSHRYAAGGTVTVTYTAFGNSNSVEGQNVSVSVLLLLGSIRQLDAFTRTVWNAANALPPPLCGSAAAVGETALSLLEITRYAEIVTVANAAGLHSASPGSTKLRR